MKKPKAQKPSAASVPRLQLEHVCIPCPHMTVKGDDIAPLWRLMPDGIMIDLPGDKKLILCAECWKVVRCECYESLIGKGTKLLQQLIFSLNKTPAP